MSGGYFLVSRSRRLRRKEAQMSGGKRPKGERRRPQPRDGETRR
jgi:hypothetical protein